MTESDSFQNTVFYSDQVTMQMPRFTRQKYIKNLWIPHEYLAAKSTQSFESCGVHGCRTQQLWSAKSLDPHLCPPFPVGRFLDLVDPNFDQPALRAIRVLRPLKLVTGFESKWLGCRYRVVLRWFHVILAPVSRPIGFSCKKTELSVTCSTGFPWAFNLKRKLGFC